MDNNNNYDNLPLQVKITRKRRQASLELECGDIAGAILSQTELWNLKINLAKQQCEEFRKNVDRYMQR